MPIQFYFSANENLSLMNNNDYGIGINFKLSILKIKLIQTLKSFYKQLGLGKQHKNGSKLFLTSTCEEANSRIASEICRPNFKLQHEIAAVYIQAVCIILAVAHDLYIVLKTLISINYCTFLLSSRKRGYNKLISSFRNPVQPAYYYLLYNTNSSIVIS